MSITPRHEYHHGRTPAAWFGAMMTLIGFVLLGLGAVLGPSWPLVIAGVACIVVGCIGGFALRIAGYGQAARP